VYNSDYTPNQTVVRDTRTLENAAGCRNYNYSDFSFFEVQSYKIPFNLLDGFFSAYQRKNMCLCVCEDTTF